MHRCINTQTAKIIQNGCEQFAAFCVFMGTSPKDCALLSGNGNTLKLETTSKLKDTQTVIATVRDLLRTFATFPAPLLSHCKLPLSSCVLISVIFCQKMMIWHINISDICKLWSQMRKKLNIFKPFEKINNLSFCPWLSLSV